MLKVTDNIYIPESAVFVKVFVLGDKDDFTLIDTGVPEMGEPIIQELEADGFKLENLKQVILTHKHIDHIGGLKTILEHCSPALAAHENDIAAIEADMKKMQFAKTTIDKHLKDGDIIDLLGGLKVINLPGHTAGSIALYQKNKKMMFVGDVIKDIPDNGLCIGKPEHYNEDTEQTLIDGQKLLEYDIEIALLSHGRPILKDDIDKLYKLKKD